MELPYSLYLEVVTVTNEYLGPAADRFIRRQIRNHLKKEPEHLNQQDLTELIDWIGAAMAFLTDDSQLVHAYILRLRKLSTARSYVDLP